MENQNLPSLRESQTGLTKSVEQAIAEPKIAQLGDAVFPELKKLLAQLFALTGLKQENYPDKLQTDVLLNYIVEDLGNYSLSDIRMAFRLAIKGELGIDANHFQSFSAAYIARIMAGYSPIRAKALNASREAENVLKRDLKIEHTIEEIKDIKIGYVFECLIKPWRHYLRTGGLTFGITPTSIIYSTLVDDLQILDVSLEKKKEIYSQAREKVIQGIDKPIHSMEEFRKQKTIKEQIEKEGVDVALGQEIKSLCYEWCIKDLYKECRENKIDLEQVISEKLNHTFKP